jgi:hypothetical protein
MRANQLCGTEAASGSVASPDGLRQKAWRHSARRCREDVSRAHGDDWRDEAEMRQRPTNDDLRRSDKGDAAGDSSQGADWLITWRRRL